MNASEEEPIPSIEPSKPVYKRKHVNWMYISILGGPILLYVLILVLISSLGEIEFIGDWQIWVFIFLVPLMGFVGGFFLKQEELQRSLITASLLLIAFMA